MENNETIIAEVAQGFEGDFTLAKLLIKASAKASADLVKFQMVYADDLAIPSYRHYHLFTSLEFNENQWLDLKNYANQFSIELCVDIFSELK